MTKGGISAPVLLSVSAFSMVVIKAEGQSVLVGTAAYVVFIFLISGNALIPRSVAVLYLQHSWAKTHQVMSG
jgi:hypothetical protein